VKFIRFAQWKIDQAGEGVLGFITNHSYLDNPTFRGMRQSLMNSFDEIYVLDLHGNSLKKEKCPDGSKDENVFDIQQGVAIVLMIKRGEKIEGLFASEAVKRGGVKRKCLVYHADLWGLRERKYTWLEEHELKNTKWQKLKPKSEFYLFIPRDERFLKLYERSPKINEIFPVNSVGIVTSRDEFVIDVDKNALKRRIRMFLDENIPDEMICATFKLKDKANWKLKLAREKVRSDENWEKFIHRILYRPFDVQWIFYHDEVIERSRKDVMQHLLESKNLALVTSRLTKGETFKHVQVTQNIVEVICMSPKTSNNGFVFPLYLYSNPKNSSNRSHGKNTTMMMVFEPMEPYRTKKPNINSAITSLLAKTYSNIPTPEEIFCYIYAVLYSNIYRTKYAEFLRIDFPRVPFTSQYKLFQRMSELGQRLVELHLLKSKHFDRPLAQYQGKGSDKVEKLRYDETTRRVYINSQKYFEKVEKEIWEYHIGGYRVCDKWLKDRKGRTLTLDDIRHYSQIVTAIAKTIAIQKEIDTIYSKVEKEIIEF
jgi:predicted helicase